QRVADRRMRAVHASLQAAFMIAVTLGAVGAGAAVWLVAFATGGDPRQQHVARAGALRRLGVTRQAAQHAMAVVIERTLLEPAVGNLGLKILRQAIRTLGGVGLFVVTVIAGIAGAVQHALGGGELAVDEEQLLRFAETRLGP